MKVAQIINQSFFARFLMVVLAIVFLISAESVNAASEPGTVTIVVPKEPINLDPINNTRGDVGQVVMKNVVETLTVVSPEDSSIALALATSWKRIDALTWQFSLRKGVKFHDGEDFNAGAAVFSIKRAYDKNIPSTTRAKFFGNVKMESKALDSHTLEIKTDKPEPLMLTLMGVLPMSSPKTPMKQLRKPIGTGPYRFVKWDAGTRIVLERFDGYWGAQPEVKKAVYIWRGESPVRASMVELGEADLAPNIAAQDAKKPDMDQSYLNSETTYLRFGGVWEPPLNDRRFRMALDYAVDRDAIRGSVLSKDVLPATQLVVQNIFGYNPDLKVRSYDPQKAKQLLDEARKDGVPVDKEITLIGRSGHFVGSAELTEALANMFKAVGLNIKMRMLESGVYKNYQRKPWPKNIGPYILLIQHDNNKGDAAFTFFFNYHCKGRNSSTCDNTLDDLIDRAQVATGEGRRSLWQAAFKRTHEEVLSTVELFHMVGYARVGKRINFKPSPSTTAEIKLADISFRK